MTRTRTPRRRGAVTVWALAVLAVVTTLSAVTFAQFARARRTVAAHRNAIQAEWLARSGVELATEKLLADTAVYTGETAKPLPGGEVVVKVTADEDRPGSFRVESRATYPVGERGVAVRVVRREVRGLPRPEIAPAPRAVPPR